MTNFRQYIPLGVFLLLLTVSFFVVKPLLMALFLSALLAFAFYPLHIFFSTKLKMNATFSAVIVSIIVLLLLLVPSILMVKAIVQESYVLFISVKQKLAVGLFQDCHNTFCQLLEAVGDDPAFAAELKDITKTVANTVVERGSDFLISIPRLALNLVVIIFTLFYLLKDGPALIRHINVLLSMQEHRYQFVLRRLKEILHGVIFGYLLIALLQGIVGGLGLFLFGVPSPLFWGVAMAFFALIPFLGTWIIWGPAATILFLNGLFANNPTGMAMGIGLFLYSFLFVASLDNLLRPKLMSRKAKIHPGVIFVGIMGGALAFGVLGVLLGPIILSAALVFIDCYFQKKPDVNTL